MRGNRQAKSVASHSRRSRTNLRVFVCFAMGYVIYLLSRESPQQEIDHEFTP